MAEILNFPDRSSIEEEAARWLAKLDGGVLSEQEAASFHEWLNASVEHRHALTELCTLWDKMGVLSELSELFPLAHTSVRRPVKRARSVTVKGLAATAAAAAAVVVAMVLFAIKATNSVDPSERNTAYQTSVGESKVISLPDGSTVNLNTDSLVSVRFDEQQRLVWLVRGEAFFKVAHEPARPFIVQAEGGSVRAVGTAFSVRLKGPQVEVVVAEGRVEISSPPASEQSAARVDDSVEPAAHVATVKAGQAAEYGADAIRSLTAIDSEAISRKLSWQHGTLIFNGEPLEQVVHEISRYTNVEIVVSDPEIRNIPIGGYFKVGEVDALLTVLEDSFAIKVRRVGQGRIYLAHATQPPG